MPTSKNKRIMTDEDEIPDALSPVDPTLDAPIDPTLRASPRYDFMRVMGDGLMGEVLQMRDRQTQTLVAARILTHALPREPKKFARHLDALSRITHPHLVQFLEHIERDGVHYVVSRFADGVDLLSYLRQPASAEELDALRQRQDNVDTHEAARTGPIEVVVGYDPARVLPGDLERTDSQELLAQPPAAAPPHEAAAPGTPAPHTGPLDPAPPSDTDLDLGDLLDDMAQDSPPTDEESVAAIVASVAQKAQLDHQARLDLVLLRLERVLPQIVDALEYLHRFKKHHGDLKPGNILVDHTGRCLLTDFGLLPQLRLRQPEDPIPQQAPVSTDAPPATTATPDEDAPAAPASASPSPLPKPAPAPPTVLTTAAPIFGPPDPQALAHSLAYRAPEDIELANASQPGPGADLYALGCVLYEAISGQRTFDGTPDEIRQQHLHAEPTPLAHLEPYCPAAWVDLIHGLLHKEPARRATLKDVRTLVETSDSYAVNIPASAIPEQDLFFGRADVIETIITEFKRCYQQNRLSVALLRGVAGVGKTAIAQAIAYLISRRGGLVLSGKCYHRESLIYQGWDEIAAQLAHIFEDLPADAHARLDLCRRQAGTLFPVLRLPGDAPVGQLTRLDAVDSLRSLLRRIATQRPLLIFIDDLHWSSWDTAGLLLDLVGDPSGLRCMVLGTWLEPPGAATHARPYHPLPAGLASAPVDVQWIDLGGFSHDEAREYVVSAGAHLSLSDQQRVLKGGASNPLLLEELIWETRPENPGASRLRLWLDDEPPADDAPPQASPPSDAPRAARPDRPAPQKADARDPGARPDDKLTAVVVERIAELSRRERFVLELLSAAGIPLPLSILSSILTDEFHTSAAGDFNARDAVERLLTMRFIQPVTSHHWPLAYRVAHNSYRALVLAELREQRLAHLCKQIAEGIRRGWPGAEELHFEYLLRAGLEREAASAALRAAASAEARFAYHRAAKLWRWLTENAQFVSFSPGVSPLGEHARLERLAHRYLQAHRLFEQAAAEAPAGLARAELLRQEFDACIRAGRNERALAALDEAFRNVGVRWAAPRFFWRFSHLARRTRVGAARWSDQISQARPGAASAEDQMRAELYRQVLRLADLLDPVQVRRVRTRLGLLAGTTHDARLLAIDRLYLARQASLMRGARHHQRILGWLHDAQRLLGELDAPQLGGVCALFLADQHRLCGDFDAAEQQLTEAARLLRSTQSPALHQRYRLRLSYAALLAARGEVDEADLVARQVLHYWRGDHYVALRAFELLIPHALLAGDTDQAQALINACRPQLAGLPMSAARIWLGRMESQLNIALGRAEVATGQLDALSEALHASPLAHDPYAVALHYLSLAQALAALAEREKSLIQHRRTDTLARLHAAWRIAHPRRHALSPALQAEAGRLHARLQLLRQHPRKALRIMTQVIKQVAHYPNPLQWLLCMEAHARVLRALELDDAPALIDQAIRLYPQYNARLPLFLEGWPIPARFSALSRDPT